MLFLLLRVLLNTTFSQLLKLAQSRDGQLLPAALVNYVAATLLSLAAIALWPAGHPHAASLWLGAATGIAYAVSLLGLETVMRIGGVSIAVAVLQLSVVVPTVASLLFFHERLDGLQGIGVMLALIALPLLSRARAATETERAPVAVVAVALVLLFGVTGVSGVTVKAFQVYAPSGDRFVFAAVLFGFASLVTAIATWVRRVPWGPLALPVGGAVGLTNLLQLVFTLSAFAALPAVVVFPVSSALTVVLNTLLAMRFWAERPDRRARVGIGLAVVSAVLLNA